MAKFNLSGRNGDRYARWYNGLAKIMDAEVIGKSKKVRNIHDQFRVKFNNGVSFIAKFEDGDFRKHGEIIDIFNGSETIDIDGLKNQTFARYIRENIDPSLDKIAKRPRKGKEPEVYVEPVISVNTINNISTLYVALKYGVSGFGDLPLKRINSITASLTLKRLVSEKIPADDSAKYYEFLDQCSKVSKIPSFQNVKKDDLITKVKGTELQKATELMTEFDLW